MAGDNTALIEAVRTGTVDDVRRQLAGEVSLAGRDDHGWTPLDWAAGRGDEAIVRALLDAGADPLAEAPLTEAEAQRTAYDIALAAGHREAALLLRKAEDTATGTGPADRGWRPYCRAYPLADLRRFPGWPAQTPDGTEDGDGIAFLHDDLTVTRSMWPGEDVLLDAVTGDWARFCADELGFRVPDELDLAAPSEPAAG